MALREVLARDAELETVDGPPAEAHVETRVVVDLLVRQAIDPVERGVELQLPGQIDQ